MGNKVPPILALEQNLLETFNVNIHRIVLFQKLSNFFAVSLKTLMTLVFLKKNCKNQFKFILK